MSSLKIKLWVIRRLSKSYDAPMDSVGAECPELHTSEQEISNPREAEFAAAGVTQCLRLLTALENEIHQGGEDMATAS